MSISSRISSMEEHVTNAYNGLQGLGADLTNVNKNIENISMVLDDIYDSMPQVSGEGTNLTLEDTRVGKIKSTLKGNTSQDGTPTPTNLIPVNVVSGNNTINICGKNLLPQNKYIATTTKNGITLTNNGDGTFNLSGTANANTTIEIVPNGNLQLEANQSYYLYSSVPYNGTTFNMSIPMTDNGTTKFLLANNTYTPTATPTNVRLQFYIGNGQSVNQTNIKLMLVKGNTAPSTYEPYVSSSSQVNLGDIELCKIGNYQDYFYKDSGKWYWHREIGKVVLNGSENWNKSTSYPGNYYYQNGVLNAITFSVNCFSNLTNIFFDSYTQLSNGDNGIMLEGGSANKTIDFKISSITTLADFKTFLGDTNLILYYVYATSTNTEITYQPLIDQLNLLEKAMSKDGQTNISQVNNDLPFIISASALKEWAQ